MQISTACRAIVQLQCKWALPVVQLLESTRKTNSEKQLLETAKPQKGKRTSKQRKLKESL